jgi:hypothetical protein
MIGQRELRPSPDQTETPPLPPNAPRPSPVRRSPLPTYPGLPDFRAFAASPLRPGSQVHTSDWLLHCGLLAITHMITAVVRGQRAACMGADLRSDCFCPPDPVVGRQTAREDGARQTNLRESGGDGSPHFAGEILEGRELHPPVAISGQQPVVQGASQASPGCLQ